MTEENDSRLHYALPDDYESRHASFLRDYRAVRRREGRGSDAAEFYLRLPDGDFTGVRGKEWRMRGESLAWLLEYLALNYGGRSLAVLDAGAGNCWMTRYLAEAGHAVTALDLNDDEYDGLGAGRHYLERLPISFRRVVADFAHLPFGTDTFDLVIYNGALHYAEDLEAVIAEGKRTLKKNGEIIVIDTPIYRDGESGEKMLAERIEAGRARYLTFELLEQVAGRLELSLKLYARPTSPVRRLKRMLLELRLRRETASMPWVVFREK